MMKIDDFMADDQDTLKEKTKQNEGAQEVIRSRNSVVVDGTEVVADHKYITALYFPFPTSS